jgi:hypothetical protein
VSWNVEGTNEFEEWFGSLSAEDQDAVDYSVSLLIEQGPYLQRPYADTVRQSRFKNMRELRSQSRGDPLRTFYAFDPRRTAILLIGGDKTGDDRFYERMVPKADALYQEYLDEITREGLI